MMDGKKLVEQCAHTMQAAQDGLAWVTDPRNAPKLSQEQVAIRQKLRRIVTEAGRLQRSAERPNCAGIFGPSQAGKSYLISILARKDQAPLIASFEGDRPEIDFIRDINPPGGDESTGVVTRFTIHPQKSPPGFPVCLRLLTQADILKIVINSYFQDGQQEYEPGIDAAALERHVASFEARATSGAADVLTEADIWDIQDYVQRNSGGAARASAIEPFWERVSVLAPRLGIVDRAGLLAVLWGQHETYTAIYIRLANALRSLDFETLAFCAVEALVPSTESVINVNALSGLHDEGAKQLPVSTLAGKVTSLPRPVLTALIAELRIVSRDKPMACFDHTDLLDFPGYRSRFKTDLSRYFRDAAADATKNVFLRGKVDYLFQRYTAELELTAMVLCVPDSVMEVATLPAAIESWIGMTHGATPEKRRDKPNLLFFALTKFDRTLEPKPSDDPDNLGDKFETRFNASLFGPFAKIEPSWVKQWRPREAFRNVFLIRNPNIPFKALLDYDGWRETGIKSTEVQQVQQLRQAFLRSSSPQQHFTDAAEAWDAVMALNDGGAGRLAQALEQVCVPELKLGQVAARLGEIRQDAVDLLSRHYVSDDFEKRRTERLAVVDDRIFPDLNICADRNTFGSALRGLMIDASDLHVAMVEALNRPNPEGPDTTQPTAPTRAVFGARSRAAPAPPRVDRWSRLASAALSSWAVHLHGRVEDPVFGRRLGLSQSSLNEIVAELGAAARRIALVERITDELRKLAGSVELNEAIARRAALVAERLINRFVSELDFNRLDEASQRSTFQADLEEPVFLARAIAFDASDLPAERPDFSLAFMQQWGYAFRATVAVNAVSKTGSLEDAVQNARLGKILEVLWS